MHGCLRGENSLSSNNKQITFAQSFLARYNQETSWNIRNQTYMQYVSTAKNTGQWNTGRRPASDRLTLIVLYEAGSGKVFLENRYGQRVQTPCK